MERAGFEVVMPLADEAVETNEKAEEGEDVWPEDVCIGRRRLQFSALRFESNLCVDGNCDTEDKWFAEWEVKKKKEKKKERKNEEPSQVELSECEGKTSIRTCQTWGNGTRRKEEKVSLSKSLSLKTLSQNSLLTAFCPYVDPRTLFFSHANSMIFL